MKGQKGNGGAAACGEGTAIYTTVSKAMITALLVAWWLFGPAVGFHPVDITDGHSVGTAYGHLLWPLSHANVWHLAGNLYFLWVVLKGALHVRECYLMAVLCSFLPVVPGLWEMIGDGENAAEVQGAMATCGFSGVLCAMVGVKWGAWIRSQGRVSAYWTFARKVLPFVAVGFLIPYINWSIHLYCLMAGVVYGEFSEILAYGRWK